MEALTGKPLQPDGKFGHGADAAVRGFVVSAGATDAATEELKPPPPLGLDIGQEFART